MKVSAPVLSTRQDCGRVESRIETAVGQHTLWYEFDTSYLSGVTRDCLDGFAVPALLMAMERGERELVLDAPVSERLLHNLEYQLAPLLRSALPGLHSVPIRPRSTRSDGHNRAPGVVTGFSGGIDSFCTVAEHLDPEDTPGYRLTHLLFCNVGSHGGGEGGRALFEQRWRHVKPFGEAVGLPFVRVDSNVDDLLMTRFEQSHALRNASAVLAFQDLFGRYLHSSTCQFQDCHFGPQGDLAHSDPAAVPLLSTERLDSVATGCEHSRVEKTRIALRLPQARSMLNVCGYPLADGGNCSQCWKCLRTLITLELLGRLDGFESVFDLDLYRRSGRRVEFLLLAPGRTDDPIMREIAELARSREAHLPRFAARVHALWPALNGPYRIAKRLVASRGRRQWSR